MSRFLVVSFLGMGVAFYQLSGGADFTPPERPLTDQKAIVSPSLEPKMLIPQASTSRLHSTAESLVQKAIIKQSNIPASAQRDTNQPKSNLTTHGLQLASLEQGLAGLSEPFVSFGPDTEATPPQDTADIRTVRASRVNMRQGPNTSYPILARLLAGDQVDVLQDDNTGWALLRINKTDQVGWVATSLLSPKGS